MTSRLIYQIKSLNQMDDLAGRIQQISVEHKQKIEAFEGRGGQTDKRANVEFVDGKFTDPDVQDRYERYLERKSETGRFLESQWIGKENIWSYGQIFEIRVVSTN